MTSDEVTSTNQPHSTYITITGPVGAGKSTLTSALTRALKWIALYETPDRNPFIADYYAGRPHFAFLTQAWFQMETLSHLHNISSIPGSYILERDIFERQAVFVEPLTRSGDISDTESRALQIMLQSANLIAPPPQIMITLRCPLEILLKRIRARGRYYEVRIDVDWLTAHTSRYDDFWSNSPIPQISIDSADLDFRDINNIKNIADQILRHVDD